MKYFVVIAALLVSTTVPYSSASVLDSLNTVREDLNNLVSEVRTILQSSTDPTLNSIVQAVTSSNLGGDLQQLVKDVQSAIQGLNVPATVSAAVTRGVRALSSPASQNVPDLLQGLTSIVKGSSNDELANLLGNLSGSVSSSSNSDGLIGILRKALSITEDKAQPKAQPQAQPKAQPKA